MKVVFVHLDLGIGGAEMLVVNAAVAACRAGHDVVIYTSHHDESRCFKETTGPGVLAGRIRVRGDWLPRHLAFGRFTALCAVARMLWLAVCVVASETVAALVASETAGAGGGARPGISGDGSTGSEVVATRKGKEDKEGRKKDAATVVFCDGVSAPVPLLRLAGPVLFYCHFPDKLLCVRRRSALKRAYRWPLDLLEEVTTGSASSVAVNSNFTAGIFREAFPRLGRAFSSAEQKGEIREGPGGAGGHAAAGAVAAGGGSRRVLRVLYPPTDVEAYPERGHGETSPPSKMGPIVSLNRFERKKNLPLAVEALGWALGEMGVEEASRRGLRLVIAGGYDKRVPENVDHLSELEACAARLGLDSLVEFRTNVADVLTPVRRNPAACPDARAELLRQASCVLYTPSREHFGIVPVEAMCCGAPVIAVNSGGPLETVVHERTGFLCDATAEAFGSAIVRLAREPSLGGAMGERGRRRVQEKFSMESFAGAFEASLQELAFSSPSGGVRFYAGFFLVGAGVAAIWATLAR
ncbi:unnamed protein product [Ectocarpus sp. 4 AP-2014]